MTAHAPLNVCKVFERRTLGLDLGFDWALQWLRHGAAFCEVVFVKYGAV